MIAINLLPGGHKSATASKFTLGNVGDLRSQIKDPWLLGATITVAASVAAVALLFSAQQSRVSDLAERMERAQRDSTRYASVLSARRKVIAERDSVQRQLDIIRTIDDARYQWAHILDEMSRALPSYTWLTVIEQTSKPPAPPQKDTTVAAGKAVPASNEKKPATASGVEPLTPSELTYRLVGQTVDIQALTLYMRQLESSPFIQKVSLVRSEIVVVDGKDITEFEITAAFEPPPPGATRTAALVVPVR